MAKATRTGRPNASMRRRIQATVIALHGTDCAACGRETIVDGKATSGRTFNLGHVIADCNGGSWSIDNLLPICRRCNVWMSGRDWQGTAPMLRQPMSAPLLADPGTSETDMDAPAWAV